MKSIVEIQTINRRQTIAKLISLFDEKEIKKVTVIYEHIISLRLNSDVIGIVLEDNDGYRSLINYIEINNCDFKDILKVMYKDFYSLEEDAKTLEQLAEISIIEYQKK